MTQKEISPHLAYVAICCDGGYESMVGEQLKSIPEVDEVVPTFGKYDLMVQIRCPTIEGLRDTIGLKIRKIPYVKTTTTLIESSGQ